MQSGFWSLPQRSSRFSRFLKPKRGRGRRRQPVEQNIRLKPHSMVKTIVRKKKNIQDKKTAVGGEIIQHNVMGKNSSIARKMDKVSAFNTYQLDWFNTYQSALKGQIMALSNLATTGGAGSTTSNEIMCGFSLNDIYDYMVYVDPAMGLVPPSGKYFQRKSVLNLLCTNGSNGEMLVDFYLCRARRDIPYNASDEKSFYKLLLAGFHDASAGGSNVPEYYGATPFQSARFVEEFKIIRKTRCFLTPGATIRYLLKDNTYYEMRTDRYKESNGSVQKLLGLQKQTYIVVPVFYGQPCVDSATKTNCAISPVKLNVVANKTYECGFITDATFTNAQNATLQPTIIAGNQSFVEELTGAVVVEANQ